MVERIGRAMGPALQSCPSLAEDLSLMRQLRRLRDFLTSGCLALLGALAALAVFANVGVADDTDVSWYGRRPYGDQSSAVYSGVVVSSRYLTMRDGTRIAIDLLLPKGLGADVKIPAILDQTRYWRSYRIRWPFSLFFGHRDAEAEKVRFVTHGYAWVDVDVRGTGASYGTCPTPAFSLDQIRDGAEIVDWIIRQPWSNGKVGATGISYGGTTAELLLTNQHPAVKAVAIRFSQFDLYTDLAFPGGIYLSSFVATWAAFTESLDQGRVPESMPLWIRLGAKLAGATVQPVDEDQDGSMLSEAISGHAGNYDHYPEIPAFTYRDDVAASGLRLDAISPHSYAKDARASEAAVYSYSGWFDCAYVHSAIKRYLTVTNPGSRLTLGPWPHGGQHEVNAFGASAEPSFDQTGELLRFFDYHLKGIDSGIAAEKPVHYFTMVEDKWKSAETWPPPNVKPTPFYLADGNTLNSQPPQAEGQDSYRADSSAGAGERTRWDGLLGPENVGYVDRSSMDSKLLLYTSAPLTQDMEVTGHPIVTLFFRSTSTDGQFFGYLEDVDERGRVFAVTEGELRAIHRRLSAAPPPYRDVVPYHSFKREDGMPLVPGQITELVFDLLPTSYLFRQGHSIRVAIAGADRDHFSPPPGDPAQVQFLRGGAHASRIDLPVIPR